MQIKRTIGPKGQLIIPKVVREYLGIKPGSDIILEVYENEIIIRPAIDPKKFIEDFTKHSKKLKRKVDVKEIKRVLEEEYEVH